ncbi:protein-tyrosine phosphatase family protein [Phaeobacter sp. B1627]|uniref:protein-tyrosine phosphatase family protein n=1 Tax=Phaeobacter sp. B1627 TaxID=2583809 RepID=UPI00111B051A|nr:protein-tyrosine phosphatase family protein [Phaeobacter sp. B1627]TNJ47571.1 protein phosphatase [Phaeobacter sp. B1627]
MVSVSDLQSSSAAPRHVQRKAKARPRPLTLHALSVGEGILALSPAPGAGGDYKEDLRLIREWRPSIVITLTTRVEHVIMGVETLGSDIQGLGSRWFHLPVEDFQIPDEETEAQWSQVSLLARQALSGGGRVLVHCRGGCGRSGMATLRLMIEAGEDPDAALIRLRQVRSCAVETDEQMDWACRAALQVSPVPPTV